MMEIYLKYNIFTIKWKNMYSIFFYSLVICTCALLVCTVLRRRSPRCWKQCCQIARNFWRSTEILTFCQKSRNYYKISRNFLKNVEFVRNSPESLQNLQKFLLFIRNYPEFLHVIVRLSAQTLAPSSSTSYRWDEKIQRQAKHSDTGRR